MYTGIQAKRLKFGGFATIALLVCATLATIVQTASAQSPPLPEPQAPIGGSAIPPSAPAFWFRQYCASCHGVDGTGDGPVAPSLKTKPADLTILSKDSGGVFPRQEVQAFIDGTRPVVAHGPQEMPVWGYPAKLPQDRLRGTFKPEFTPVEVEARINLIVDYVKSIQRK